MQKARNDMSIENNAAARDMLRRLLADTENKIRSAYNYGFKDGTEQGRAEAIESIVKYSFICEQLARDFEIPCNFSPMDEIMLEDGRCEKDCGEIPESECWKRYFEVMQRRAEQ